MCMSVCMCVYICTGMSSRVVLGSLFQERAQDYGSQMEAGAIPHTCNGPETHALPLPILPPSSPPQITACFCLQRKIL